MNESQRHIFSGLQVLGANQWLSDQAVIVEDRIIKAVIPANMIKHHLPACHYEYAHDYFLVPGFIDCHIHGTHGHDVMDGTFSALQDISQALAREGVTGFLATTMTAANEELERALETIAAAMPVSEGAAILGIHLEGPFISKTKMGAQLGDYIILPDVNLMRKWQRLAKGAIKVVTLAPELPGALDFIAALHEMQVIAAIGHTNATYEQTCTAIKAGCTQATHLYNAMSGLHQRQVGAAGAILLAPQVAVEMIVDGLHLHPALVALTLRLKNKDDILLVTDAMRAKCLAKGQYAFGGQEVLMDGEKVMLANGTLAGSILSMPQAIKNMMAFTQCSLPAALAMASSNPARILGLDRSKGTINVGKDADLVVLNAELQVLMTMRGGRVLFRANNNN